MKQTITILAAFTVALLLVSGFIVMGSMHQAQQLSNRNQELLQAKERLTEQIKQTNALTKRVEELSTSLEAVQGERDGYKLRLHDALLSVEEANGAISQQVLEKDSVAASLEKQQTLAQALKAELDAAIAERDALSARVKELEAQAKAATDSQADAKKAENELRALEGECAAYRALLTLWNDARLGAADVTALEDAHAAFVATYPQSLFALPNSGTGEPMPSESAIAPITQAPAVTPSASPAPTPELLLRTFAPVVTLLP